MSVAATGKRKRRIMREFSIGEISAVDNPAQQGAKMAIVKREDPAEPRANDPAFLQHCDDVWKARRDAVLKDLVAAYHEDAAKVSKKEETMTNFSTEVEKARTTGKSRTEAMAAARKADPKAFENYRRQNTTTKSDGLPRRLVKTASQEEFESKVRQIAASDNISMDKAVVKARKAHPQLFKRAYPR
jgi:hypothetical protein